ncbi:DNA polymerase Y family protein [Isoptericola sp. b441]|uniref:DNA polymerase Y family protein n=1 Tax=Actinotalea lenta TaxID=3064654 RepID=A0ABT9DAE1_9CELL|nr:MULTISPECIES: DNA polymerase Y family protein [unclassified Isoptericola]MDO8107530.1 DNA polymerase Y family protein [Isoptericola sp. b441]MDO8120810.1 DNA polymerase Y family protein [Isoptericola sp. b490]
MTTTLAESVAQPAHRPRRTAALWVPDWPVLAAMATEQVPAHLPAAVHDGRQVLAASAPARRSGVRRGMRRRAAQQCCPELVLLPADPGRDVREFEQVVLAAETVVAGLEVVRPGLLLLPAAGAGRYHGSERTLAERLVDAVATAGHEASVGLADGVGAAVLAARAHAMVAAGATAQFLAGRSVAELRYVTTAAEVADLVDLLVRLGVRTLGDLALLPRADVLARFGPWGEWAHRVASGQDDRPTALRRPERDMAVSTELDPPVERLEQTAFVARRLAEELHAAMVTAGVGCGRVQIAAATTEGAELVRTWRTDTALGGLSVPRLTDRVRWQLDGWLTAQRTRRSGAQDPAPGPLTRLALRAEEVVAVGSEQGRLWGQSAGADLRAQRAVHRVQGLLGTEAVLSARVQGGREVRDQVHLVPWGEDRPAERRVDAPWPGRLPSPAPATVPVEPVAIQLCGTDGRRVEVDPRLRMSADPAVIWWPDGTSQSSVTGWAGPWPVVQRWWSGTGHHAVYLQVTVDDGRAVLLALRDGVWTLEAHYD